MKTASSYAAAEGGAETEELRHKALSGDIYRDVSDFKTSTLMWVMGIVLAGVLGMVALTLTMNDSLREDLIRRIEDLRSEFRRDGDRLNDDVENLDARIQNLEARPSVDANNNN